MGGQTLIGYPQNCGPLLVMNPCTTYVICMGMGTKVELSFAK